MNVAVAGLALDGECRLLLGRRAKDPGRGAWILPGGRVGRESLTFAVVREFDEETGLGFRPAGLPGDAGLAEWNEDGERWVVIYSHGRVTGDPMPGGDVDDLLFVNRAELAVLFDKGGLWWGSTATILERNGWLYRCECVHCDRRRRGLAPTGDDGAGQVHVPVRAAGAGGGPGDADAYARSLRRV